ncbi:hypothetical protein H0H93_010517 [Arthromyces matolae]|nr:hypothetical protein H0H93_010517 [Arthromyces matolae]
MASKTVDSPFLSCARINRLLRPLRSRCLSLAKLRARHNSDSVSLDILPQPGSLCFRQFLDSEQAEMARKIHSVRDCFQDIVHNTKTRHDNNFRNRIPKLAAICATIIGENMESQLEDSDKEEVEHVGQKGPDYFLSVVDELYDAIPDEYRRSTLLSHALSIVLCYCGDDATLLIRLLEVSLDHNLYLEGATLLYSLINLALGSTSPSKPSPVSHPKYADFFIDLHARYNFSGLSQMTFFRVLIRALKATSNSHSWSSKAVQNIAHVMYTQDYQSYLQLALSLSLYVNEHEQHHRWASIDSGRKNLLSCLFLWLKNIHERFSPITNRPETLEGYVDTISRMLVSLFPLISCTDATMPPQGIRADIEGVLLSLSVLCLTFRSTSLDDEIVEYLSAFLPCCATFTPLVAKLFADSMGCLQNFRDAIQDMATTFRNSDLLHLHASFLGCTLHFIELPSRERELTDKNTASEVQAYRHNLIRMTDEAESKFMRPREATLGRGSHFEVQCTISTPLRKELFKDISEWDPRSAKKRKLVHPHRQQDRVDQLKPLVENRLSEARSSTCDRPFSTLLSSAASSRALIHQNEILQAGLTGPKAPERPRAYQNRGPVYDDDDHFQCVSLSDDALNLFALGDLTY